MVQASTIACLCADVYQDERDRLSSKQVDDILHAGRKWDLSKTLSSGGVAIFPHTYISQCGAYIAACVHGALDSGADHVVVLGVLHSFIDVLCAARAKEKVGEDLLDSVLRGIHGLGLDRGEYWQQEYSLLSFIFLWDEEVKRRGIKAPKLTLRFPYLVNKDPKTLPGINELEALAKDACLIATSDFCHHGVAYGVPKEQAKTGLKAVRYAKKTIQEHLGILQTGDLARFYNHCHEIRSDSFDVGTMLCHLRGHLRPTVCDVTIVDTSALYEGTPSPSWVAASLVKLEK